MNVSILCEVDYVNGVSFRGRQNKPNSKPILWLSDADGKDGTQRTGFRIECGMTARQGRLGTKLEKQSQSPGLSPGVLSPFDGAQGRLRRRI